MSNTPKDENEETIEACAECGRFFNYRRLTEGVCPDCQKLMDRELAELLEGIDNA